MLLLRPPGVYRPQSDTHLLLHALCEAAVPVGGRVLEVCTGTGALALAAAARSRAGVTAIDLSLRAVLATRVNAQLNGVAVRVLRGDLFTPVRGEIFDIILANPPYVPGRRAAAGHGRARAWEAGPDGRALLDRICVEGPSLLTPAGTLLVVHSALCGTGATLTALRAAGLKASVIARRHVPFGPVMRARVSWLQERGLIRPGQRDEELVVIRADRTEPAS